MTRAFRATSLLSLGFLLAGLTGCFTEVGNPEEEVKLMTAEFRVDYTPDTAVLGGAPDSVSLSEFQMTLKDAGYLNADSTGGSLWQDAVNHSVDFLGAAGTDTLPRQPLKSGTLAGLHMSFTLPTPDTLLPDTVDFPSFHHSAYMKGIYRYEGSTKHFLFALSDSTLREINLSYSRPALNNWYQNGGYHCMIVFSALKWFSGVTLQRIVADTDKSGDSLVVFDLQHNLETYLLLKDRFFQNFNTQQVYLDTLAPQ